MIYILRKTWFRTGIVIVGLIAITAVYPFLESDNIRDGVYKALQASSLLFTVCTALSLAVLNNYVKGLQDSAIKHVFDSKTILEKFYDEFHDSEDDDIKQLVVEYIIPLLYLSADEWLAYEPLRPILDRLESPLYKISEKHPDIPPRYLLRLEDELNQIGLIYVRRIKSQFHSDTIQGALYLICVGILVIFIAAVLPQSYLLNFLVMSCAVSVAIFAILEILLLVSYIRQEAREEFPDELDDEADLHDINDKRDPI